MNHDSKLLISSYNGDINQVKMLIRYKLKNDTFEKALCHACKNGDLKMAKLLIKNVKSLKYPLYHACKNNNLKIVIYLLQNGADKYSNKGLIGASIGGDLSIVKLMIKNGATDIDKAYSNSYFSDHKEVSSYLKNIGANDKLIKYHLKNKFMTLIQYY